MSVSLLKKTVLLMGDLQNLKSKKKSSSRKGTWFTAVNSSPGNIEKNSRDLNRASFPRSFTEAPLTGLMVEAKKLNKMKLVKFSAKEKQTRRLIEDLRRKSRNSGTDFSKNLVRVQKYDHKCFVEWLKLFSRVRWEIYKTSHQVFFSKKLCQSFDRTFVSPGLATKSMAIRKRH